MKSPKIYVRDSGLVHALLGLGSFHQVVGHPVVGMSWEGFVLENLLSVLPWRSSAFFYRTSAGAEIDLVIEHPNSERWAVEIKRSLSAKIERGFHIACDNVRPTRAFVVHAGDAQYPLSKKIDAIGARGLSEILRNLAL